MRPKLASGDLDPPKMLFSPKIFPDFRDLLDKFILSSTYVKKFQSFS